MSNWFILFLMVFLHITDDFYLQGWLATAKQKLGWELTKKEREKKLKDLELIGEGGEGKTCSDRFDYICALGAHSFSWSFMIMLPIAYTQSFEVGLSYVIAFLLNFAVHGVVDYLKANKGWINLWIDQLIHFCQILVTFLIFVVL